MNITINEDLSSHIIIGDNERECFLSNINPLTQTAFGSEEEVRLFCNTALTDNYFQLYKSPEQREQERLDTLASINISKARVELFDTDWYENSSVRDTSLTPHLTNTSEFDVYRLQLRNIIVNKIAQVETWPTKPNSVWSTT